MIADNKEMTDAPENTPPYGSSPYKSRLPTSTSESLLSPSFEQNLKRRSRAPSPNVSVNTRTVGRQMSTATASAYFERNPPSPCSTCHTNDAIGNQMQMQVKHRLEEFELETSRQDLMEKAKSFDRHMTQSLQYLGSKSPDSDILPGISAAATRRASRMELFHKFYEGYGMKQALQATQQYGNTGGKHLPKTNTTIGDFIGRASIFSPSPSTNSDMTDCGGAHLSRKRMPEEFQKRLSANEECQRRLSANAASTPVLPRRFASMDEAEEQINKNLSEIQPNQLHSESWYSQLSKEEENISCMKNVEHTVQISHDQEEGEKEPKKKKCSECMQEIMHTVFRHFPIFMALPLSLFIFCFHYSSESEQKIMKKVRILMSISTILTQALVVFLYIHCDFYPYGWTVFCVYGIVYSFVLSAPLYSNKLRDWTRKWMAYGFRLRMEYVAGNTTHWVLPFFAIIIGFLVFGIITIFQQDNSNLFSIIAEIIGWVSLLHAFGVITVRSLVSADQEALNEIKVSAVREAEIMNVLKKRFPHVIESEGQHLLMSHTTPENKSRIPKSCQPVHKKIAETIGMSFKHLKRLECHVTNQHDLHKHIISQLEWMKAVLYEQHMNIMQEDEPLFEETPTYPSNANQAYDTDSESFTGEALTTTTLITTPEHMEEVEK